MQKFTLTEQLDLCKFGRNYTTKKKWTQIAMRFPGRTAKQCKQAYKALSRRTFEWTDEEREKFAEFFVEFYPDPSNTPNPRLAQLISMNLKLKYNIQKSIEKCGIMCSKFFKETKPKRKQFTDEDEKMIQCMTHTKSEQFTTMLLEAGHSRKSIEMKIYRARKKKAYDFDSYTKSQQQLKLDFTDEQISRIHELRASSMTIAEIANEIQSSPKQVKSLVIRKDVWSYANRQLLLELCCEYGSQWSKIAELMNGKDINQCKKEYRRILSI
jgi:hypothetical protein